MLSTVCHVMGVFMDCTVLDKSSKRQAPFCLKPRIAQILILRGMTTAQSEAVFNEALCARTHELRNERGYTSAQMATALGVPAERYRKYEYRSPMPAYLWERFALIVGCDLAYLLTGKAEKRQKQAQSSGKQAA